MSNQIFTFVQIIVSILLVTTILLQQRGTALSGVFGGEGNVYATRRGIQKLLLITTIILTALFIGLAILQLVSTAFSHPK